MQHLGFLPLQSLYGLWPWGLRRQAWVFEQGGVRSLFIQGFCSVNCFGMFGGSPWLTPSGITKKANQLRINFVSNCSVDLHLFASIGPNISRLPFACLGVTGVIRKGISALQWDPHRAAFRGTARFASAASWWDFLCPHLLSSFDDQFS